MPKRLARIRRYPISLGPEYRVIYSIEWTDGSSLTGVPLEALDRIIREGAGEGPWQG